MRGRPLIIAAAVAFAACNGDRPDPTRDVTTEVVTVPDTLLMAPAPDVVVGVGTAAEARTALLNARGDTVGRATMRDTEQGVQISISVRGMPPGEKGFHIHTVGSCVAPAFESAGPHFAPQGRQHGFENPAGPHAGDLRNLNVGADGFATQEFTNEHIIAARGAKLHLRRRRNLAGHPRAAGRLPHGPERELGRSHRLRCDHQGMTDRQFFSC